MLFFSLNSSYHSPPCATRRATKPFFICMLLTELVSGASRYTVVFSTATRTYTVPSTSTNVIGSSVGSAVGSAVGSVVGASVGTDALRRPLRSV